MHYFLLCLKFGNNVNQLNKQNYKVILKNKKRLYKTWRTFCSNYRNMRKHDAKIYLRFGAFQEIKNYFSVNEKFKFKFKMY